jgi:RNA ligase
MKYRFPYITHIDHVLPFIKDRDEFIVAEKEGYKVINYVISHPETFSGGVGDDIRRECRGIIFDTEGKLIRRPYHKFFNLGEKEETFIQNVDFSRPHLIYEKIDGSMIAPFFLQGYVRWGTKMGITDVAMQAEEFVAQHKKYQDFAQLMLENGYTPIFEWCSPKQKIVLDYKEESLPLTAIRKMNGGEYMSYEEMEVLTTSYNIPLVEVIPYSTTTPELIDDIAKREDQEGIVICFDNGHRLKVKTEWYCRIHKCKEKITRENDVIDLWLNNGLDDVLAFLPEEDKNRINTFIERIRGAVLGRAMIDSALRIAIRDHQSMDRKSFALNHAPSKPRYFNQMMFKHWDIPTRDLHWMDINKFYLDYMKKHVTNSTKYKVMKNELFRDIEF